MRKSRINNVLNVIIVVLVIVVITIGSVFFIRASQQNKSEKNETVSKAEKSSSSKKHKAKRASTERSEQSTGATDGAVATQTYGDHTQQENNPQTSGSQEVGDQANTSPRSDGVVVVNGMDFYYRAAQALGLISEGTPIMDFYDNCQYYGDGGFTYNGQSYNSEVIHDGHENEYHCNILVTPAN
jgi:hypothetical protein